MILIVFLQNIVRLKIFLTLVNSPEKHIIVFISQLTNMSSSDIYDQLDLVDTRFQDYRNVPFVEFLHSYLTCRFEGI